MLIAYSNLSLTLQPVAGAPPLSIQNPIPRVGIAYVTVPPSALPPGSTHQIDVSALANVNTAEVAYQHSVKPWALNYRVDVSGQTAFQVFATVTNDSSVSWNDIDLTLVNGPARFALHHVSIDSGQTRVVRLDNPAPPPAPTNWPITVVQVQDRLVFDAQTQTSGSNPLKVIILRIPPHLHDLLLPGTVEIFDDRGLRGQQALPGPDDRIEPLLRDLVGRGLAPRPLPTPATDELRVLSLGTESSVTVQISPPKDRTGAPDKISGFFLSVLPQETYSSTYRTPTGSPMVVVLPKRNSKGKPAQSGLLVIRNDKTPLDVIVPDKKVQSADLRVTPTKTVTELTKHARSPLSTKLDRVAVIRSQIEQAETQRRQAQLRVDTLENRKAQLLGLDDKAAVAELGEIQTSLGRQQKALQRATDAEQKARAQLDQELLK